MYATYPIGVPLMVAATTQLTSWRYAAKWVMWAHALACLVLLYAFARHGRLSPGWSALAVLMLALSPLYLQHALVLMSDLPATLWMLAAMLCALRGRESTRWALAAGALTGVAVLIRPSNVLMVGPAVLAIGRSPRRLLTYLAGGVPFAIAYFCYNALAHSPVVTGGYGDLERSFGLRNIGPTLAHYGHWLPIQLTPLGLFALGAPFLWKRDARLALVLTAWMGVYGIFYAFYSYTHETWWFMRFVMPAYPAALVAALLVMREALNWLRVTRWGPAGSVRAWGLGLAAAVAIVAFDVHWNSKLTVLGNGEGERSYADSVDWLRREVPANAVVVAMQMSGSLFYYSDFTIVRWDSLEENDFAQVMSAAAAAGRPVYALFKPIDLELMKNSQRLYGMWTRLGTAYGTELCRYDGGTSAPYTVREAQ